jgi:decaprenylphospho-beta-D-erythro-pentofuranosid-2-ulose 2-reductase
VKDALGRVRSVLLLGGTSDIGLALVRRLAAAGTERVLLAGRDPDRLAAAAAQLPVEVHTTAFDAADPAGHDALVATARDTLGDLDLVVVAFAQLIPQPELDRDPDRAVEVAQVNYVGAVSVLARLTPVLRAQGHGTVVVVSSVAGDRVRADNYTYGSTKAGLDGYAQGLGDALRGDGVDVIIVRPGFVRSRMTTGMAAAPFATTPEVVAEQVAAALQRGRTVVYVPGALRWVMALLRVLPRPLFRLVRR